MIAANISWESGRARHVVESACDYYGEHLGFMHVRIAGTPWDLTTKVEDFIGTIPAYDYEVDKATGFLCVMD